MPYTQKCTTCKGEGSVDYLISMHDDKKENLPCKDCGGSGEQNRMTDQEEVDYWEDYW